MQEPIFKERRSQIIPTEFVINKVKEWRINKIETIEDILLLKNLMFNSINVLEYNESSKQAEANIRWKRTGSQVLEDGYVYNGKSCTDYVVTFITLLSLFKIETRFVKVKNNETRMVHSLMEFKLNNKWYRFDVSTIGAIPIEGEITLKNPFGKFQLWKKGKDSWDLELDSIEKITDIQI